MKGFGKYETMVELDHDLNKKISSLQMQLAQNYVCMINVKKSLYNYSIFGFADLHKPLNWADAYIKNNCNKLKTEDDKKKAKNYHDILISGIESTTGIKVKEIYDIHFMFDDTSFEIYFMDDKDNKLSIQVPNIDSPVYDILAQDIDIGLGYDKFHHRCLKLLSGLDTTLYLVSNISEYTVNKKLITSFPDKVMDICDFKKYYDQYLLAQKEMCGIE